MKYLFVILSLIPTLVVGQDHSVQKPKIEPQWMTGTGVMVLAVEFLRESRQNAEELRITVTKNKALPRPELISISIPRIAIGDQGITLAFWNEKRKFLEMTRTAVSSCDDELCTFSFENSLFVDQKKNIEIDVFSRMKDNDIIYLSFKDHDSVFVVTEIALSNFYAKYQELD